MTVRMILASEDEQYIEAFTDYVASSGFARKVSITAFSRLEAFMRYLDKGRQAELIAAEPSFLSPYLSREELKEIQRLPWVCLSESGREDGFDRVESKYQPLHELLPALLKAVQGEAEVAGTKTRDDGSARVIGFYSAAGGSGKTTAALQVARHLSSGGAKVFFLNLESFQEVRTGQGGEAAGLAGLLYELKASTEANRLPDKAVASFSVRQPLMDCDTFPGIANLRELLEMSKDDAVRLIDYVAETGKYDFIVIDANSEVDGRTAGMLERCDRLVWLLGEDDISMGKSSAYLAYLENYEPSLYSKLLRKTVFTLSKHYGVHSNSPSNFPSNAHSGSQSQMRMNPAFKLPFIPEWGQRAQHHLLQDSPLYKRELMKLCRYLAGEERLMAGVGTHK